MRPSQRIKTRSYALVILLALGFLPCLRSDSLGNPVAPAVDELYVELLRELHGIPRILPATDSVCVGLDPPSDHLISAKAWFLEPGRCMREYQPDLRSVVTPAMFGVPHWNFGDEKFVEGLLYNLKELARRVRRNEIPPIARLELQNIAWEIRAGLAKNMWRKTTDSGMSQLTGEPARRLDLVQQATLVLLQATLFDDATTRELPSTLPRLAQEECDGFLGNFLQALVRRDESVLEIDQPSLIHMGMTDGRWSGRIFLRLRNPESGRELQAYLAKAVDIELSGFSWASADRSRGQRKIYSELEKLIGRFPGVQALIVLYFNVLDMNMQIRPTPIIAEVRGYEVDDRITDELDLLTAYSRLRFFSIVYERNLVWSANMKPQYRSVPVSKVEIKGLFTVPQTDWGGTELLTTNRGRCLDCHVYSVNALAVREAQGVRSFSRPYQRSAEEIIPPQLRVKFEKKLGARRKAAN